MILMFVCLPGIKWKFPGIFVSTPSEKDGLTVKKLLSMVAIACFMMTFAIGCGDDTGKAKDSKKADATPAKTETKK